MGVFVNGHWREDLADPNPNGGSNLSSPTQSPSHPNYNGGGQRSAAVATAPPPAGMPSGLGDTNDQSVRADLRKQNYYIDDTGVYAPGAGQRLGDTFSGSMAGQNVAPSPTRLPIINGTPVSPSNGTTGPQTGAIMYRGDPLYSTYFGPGTPGATSTSGGDNARAAPLPAGQQTLEDFLGQSGTTLGAATSVGAPAAMPAPPAAPASAATSYAPNPTVQSAAAPVAAAGPDVQSTDQAAWMAGVTAANPAGGFGPYMTAEAPALEDQGQYVDEHGRTIKKSVDQYGHPYYQTVGAGGSASTAAPASQPAAAASAAPATTAASAPPASPADTVPLTLPDGNVVNVPRAFYQEYLDAGQKQAAAAHQATLFQQGIQQGQLDVQRMVATYQKAYQDAVLAGQTAQRAQDLALAQMKTDLEKQTLELNKTIAGNTALYQQQQIDLQRSQQTQTLGLEREKLDLQRSQQAQALGVERERNDLARRQMRGRRLPQVRYA